MCPLRDVEDILPIVLSFLDNETLLKSARCVSRKWHHAVTGTECSMFHFRGSHTKLASQSLCLRGRFADKVVSYRPCKTPRCVKGRLPEPRMDFDLETSVGECDVNARKGNLIYHSPSLRQGPKNNFVSLDLILALNASDSGRVPVSKANLSMLRGLKQISSTGSSCLTHLSLSGNVLGLNLSGSSKLQKLIVTSIEKESASECHLRSLNLSGCRSLQTIDGPGWSNFCCNLQEVDLSLCSQFCRKDMANLLQATRNLRSLSLRYVATDEILIALSNSQSAMNSLTMMDIAFSQDVTDRGVAALLDRAVHLKHLHLRACGNISPQCYHETPMLLKTKQLSMEEHKNQQGTMVDHRHQPTLFQIMLENAPNKRQRTDEMDRMPVMEQRKVVVF